jgi:hypothetical protein
MAAESATYTTCTHLYIRRTYARTYARKGGGPRAGSTPPGGRSRDPSLRRDHQDFGVRQIRVGEIERHVRFILELVGQASSAPAPWPCARGRCCPCRSRPRSRSGRCHRWPVSRRRVSSSRSPAGLRSSTAAAPAAGSAMASAQPMRDGGQRAGHGVGVLGGEVGVDDDRVAIKRHAMVGEHDGGDVILRDAEAREATGRRKS